MINLKKNRSPFIVAELSANHNQKLKNLFRLIKNAKKSGADAVKIQTINPETITINSNNKDFIVKKGLWKGQNLFKIYKKASLNKISIKKAYEYAKNIKIKLFSSIFDISDIDFLEKLNNPIYKIASPEIVDLELIKNVAKCNKPTIISTGMASKQDIKDAVNTFKKYNNKLILLHCVSGYPTPLKQSYIKDMIQIKKDFNTQVGISDHSLGIVVPIVATVLGASVIEKHFKLPKIPSLDSKFSLTPIEFKNMVINCNAAFETLKNSNYLLKKIEKENLPYRRSLYAIKNISKGEKITSINVKSIRPGLGLKPKFFNSIKNKTAKKNIPLGSAILLKMLK